MSKQVINKNIEGTRVEALARGLSEIVAHSADQSKKTLIDTIPSFENGHKS
jgi:hypothetical protein